MSRRRVPLPSPAMAVALCALFVALGGASSRSPSRATASDPTSCAPMP